MIVFRHKQGVLLVVGAALGSVILMVRGDENETFAVSTHFVD